MLEMFYESIMLDCKYICTHYENPEGFDVTARNFRSEAARREKWCMKGKEGGQVFASHAWSLEKTFVPEIK